MHVCSGVWMCILNLEENLCTGCKVIYCRKSISINTYSSSLHQIIMFLIKKVKIRNRLFCCVFFLLFFYPHMLEYNQSSFSIATCAVVGTFITDMTICSVNMWGIISCRPAIRACRVFNISEGSYLWKHNDAVIYLRGDLPWRRFNYF